MEKKGGTNIKLGDAIDDKIISNQYLAYLIGRIYQFLLLVGVDEMLPQKQNSLNRKNRKFFTLPLTRISFLFDVNVSKAAYLEKY